MKELPIEVWTMIVRLSKRQQPPPRVQANWNDDFNQQDLISLMRVNKSMYQIVAPILYEEPIVQNIGLFFLGVEQPTPGHNEINGQTDVVSQSETITDQSIPYHKRHLLDLVKTLHVIRASSRLPVDKCYMEYPHKAHLEFLFQLEGVKCDSLGRGEVDGWILAESLLSRLADQSDSKLRWDIAFPNISFRRLTALTFGLWDDGRWGTYEEKAHIRDKHDDDLNDARRRWERRRDDISYEDYVDLNEKDKNEPDESASPHEFCEDILAGFLFRTLGRQAVNVCQHTNLGLSIFGKAQYHCPAYRLTLPITCPGTAPRICPVAGLRVIHGCQDPGYARAHDGEVIFAGPTRIFNKYSLGLYDERWNTASYMLSCLYDRFERSTAAYVACYPDRHPDECHSAMTLSLGICVLPGTEGADVVPPEAHIRAEIGNPFDKWGPLAEVIQGDKEESDALKRGELQLGRGRQCRRELFFRAIPYNVYVGDNIPPCPVCGLKE